MLNEIYLVQIQSQIINIEEETKYIYIVIIITTTIYSQKKV